MRTQILDESTLTVDEAAKRMRVHLLTCLRWIHDGDSNGVRLEAINTSRWLTSREAVDRFVERRVSAKQKPRRERPPGKPRRRRVRLTRHEADEHEALRLGI